MRIASLIIVAAFAACARTQPPASHAFENAVQEAERDPGTFTPTLRKALDRLTGAQLIEGMAFEHPRPEVNARIKDLLAEALCYRGEHTAESATALLALAMATQDRPHQLRWIDLLSRDDAGRTALQKFIEDNPDRPDGIQLMVAFVSGASQRMQSEVMRDIEKGTYDLDQSQPVPESLKQVVDHYTEEIWVNYVHRRATTGKGPVDNLHVSDIYAGRLAALLGAEVRAGRRPSRDEVRTLAGMMNDDPAPLRELLQWAESGDAPLRRIVVKEWLFPLAFSKQLSPSDRVRVRRILMAAMNDDQQAERTQMPFFIARFMDNLSVDEARTLAKLSLSEDHPEERAEVLMAVADQFDEFREPVFARLTNATDMEDWGLQTQSHRWISDMALGWIATVSTHELRSEKTQERFRRVARLLSGELWWAVKLPERRTTRPPLSCGTPAMMAYGAAVQERSDLKAFGLPLPEKTPDEQVPSIHGKPPVQEEGPRAPQALTPKETTARWRSFVSARDAFLNKAGVVPFRTIQGAQ